MWHVHAVDWSKTEKHNRVYGELVEALDVAATLTNGLTLNWLQAQRCIAATDGYTGLYGDTFVTVRRVLAVN